MYKNEVQDSELKLRLKVSILVLMELCIKTDIPDGESFPEVSSFNPCFNGTMYKNRGKRQVFR